MPTFYGIKDLIGGDLFWPLVMSGSYGNHNEAGSSFLLSKRFKTFLSIISSFSPAVREIMK